MSSQRPKKLPKLATSHSNTGRSLDERQERKTRASRPGQSAPTNVPGRRGQGASGGGGGEGSGSDDDGGDGPAAGYLAWGERQGRQHTAWDEREEADIDAFVASLPQQAAQLSARQAAVVQERQALLYGLEPFPSCCPKYRKAEDCCQFHKAGTKEAVFFAPLGVRSSLTVPLFECTTHGEKGLTAHPLQFSCVPTMPKDNTKLLDVDLVEQFRLLQLKDGVGGHGGCRGAAALVGWMAMFCDRVVGISLALGETNHYIWESCSAPACPVL